MVDVDYKWFLNANLNGYDYEKRIIAPIFTGLKNLTIRNTDLLIPKPISGELDVTTFSRIMEVSEA